MTFPDSDLVKNAANFTQLTPLTLIARAAQIRPNRTALIYGARRYTWAETYSRCRRLASALQQRGVTRGDVVAIIAPNIPALYEVHFGVPMLGAVLNTLNIRQDAASLAYMLDHGGAKVILVDREFSPVIAEALKLTRNQPLVIDIDDPAAPGPTLGETEYETLLQESDPNFAWSGPNDEWDAISLNYTSGTTGNPKGVVYSHRGAYMNAIGNALATELGGDTVFLWSLPMFHCNGWCVTWTMAALAGCNVCLRRVEVADMFQLIAEHRVNFMCGAAVILNLFLNAPEDIRRTFPRRVHFNAAAAPVPVPIIRAATAMGFDVTHMYGLTETYGPATLCVLPDEFEHLNDGQQELLLKRQGMRFHVLEGVTVIDPTTMTEVPADGETMGEVMFRGNIVMKGYLKNPDANAKELGGGWFHSGDLGVLHPDGAIELKDRSKDIIISGGENISSIEVEAALYRHPAVLEAAVVAKQDDRWGEVPCAFVSLREGHPAPTVDEIIEFCRNHLAHFKAPKHVIFGALNKTATGKVQKYLLRKRAEESI